MEVFGSYATDLCLPSSDIDLVVVGAPSGPQGFPSSNLFVVVFALMRLFKARLPFIPINLLWEF